MTDLSIAIIVGEAIVILVLAVRLYRLTDRDEQGRFK